MKKFLIASMGLVAAVILAASTSSAQVAAWDVSGHGSPIDTTLVAGTSDANLLSVPVLSRVDIPGSSAGNTFSGSNWNITATMNVNDQYFTFTATAKSGYSLNLTSLSFNMCGSNTAPNNDAWGYSADGGSWVIEPTWHALLSPITASTWDFADFTATSVEFRFWAWGTSPINGATSGSLVGGTTRIANASGNDLVLGGTVVPEPSTIALIGFGLVGMLAFGRRRFSRS